jgi:hypothetical protein
VEGVEGVLYQVRSSRAPCGCPAPALPRQQMTAECHSNVMHMFHTKHQQLPCAFLVNMCCAVLQQA